MKINESNFKEPSLPLINKEIVFGEISFTLWLEFEHWTEKYNVENNTFSMKISLIDGDDYSLNVWTFNYFLSQQKANKTYGSHQNGKYLRPPDLFVEKLDRPLIEQCVIDLIKNDELKDEWLDEEYDSEGNIISDFELLVEIAYDLSQQFAGISTKDQRKAIATQILAKAVPNCFSLLKLIPGSKYSTPEDNNLDFGSVASLARNLIELANVQWYLSVEELTQEEQEFRLLLFNYHDSYSLKSIGQCLNFKEEDIEYLFNQTEVLKTALEKNVFYLSLDKGSQKLILKGKKSTSLTQFEIAEKRGINLIEFKGYYMLLSVHTHSSPTSIKQKVFEQQYDLEGEMDKVFTLLLINYCCKFLADLVRTTGNMWDLKFAKILSEEIVVKYSNMLK